MPEDAGKTPEPPTHGCMECKAPRRDTVEHFTNGNTGWRCTVCGKIFRSGGMEELTHCCVAESLWERGDSWGIPVPPLGVGAMARQEGALT